MKLGIDDTSLNRETSQLRKNSIFIDAKTKQVSVQTKKAAQQLLS